MNQKKYVEGLLMGGGAFTLWGLLPLYWKWMNVMSPYEIFVQRVVWSFVFVAIVLLLKKQISGFIRILKRPQNWMSILGPSLFISINWLVYIWGVNNNYVIETSLGYYINPLVLTMFGSVFFKEKLTKLQKIGIVFAGAGVAAKTLMYGRVPVIALILAFSFAIYGLLKKKSKLDSLTGLAFETLTVGIPSIFYLVFTEVTGNGIVGNLPFYYWGMIALSGIVTAVPLLLYAEGTKRLPLSVVGFLQYIAPTIGLILGIFVFKEPFDLQSLFAFVLIWIGLAFFTYSQYRILNQKESPQIQAVFK